MAAGAAGATARAPGAAAAAEAPGSRRARDVQGELEHLSEVYVQHLAKLMRSFSFTMITSKVYIYS